jgi:hypothetical protein
MKLTQINKKFRQGVYNPTNRKKYKGNDIPRFLSSWELKLFRWCDSNDDILEWSSECIAIQYTNPLTGKTSCYFPDVAIKMKVGNDVKKFLVEIKPYRQTIDPKNFERKNKKKKSILYEDMTYLKNVAKWKAAEKWCEKMGYEFTLLTEKELGINKYDYK